MTGRPGLAEKRLSAHRFQQIPDHLAPDTMLNPNDVTIDIPLTSVSSRGQTGARKGSVNTPASPNPGYVPPQDGADSPNPDEKSDLVSSNGRRRKRIDSSLGMSAETPEDGTITRMGRFYQSVLNFSFVTRYMIYVAPIALLIAIPIIVGATAAPNAKIGGVPLSWFFAWIEVVWVSLWVSKVFARVVPFVFQFLCGIVSSGTRKYALILQSLEIPITTVLWMLVSLVTFLPMMTLNPRKKEEGDTATKPWEKSVKNVLFALLVCSLIFLAEKAIVQLISISYHRKQFDTKIKESKRNVHLVGVLYDASRSMFPMYCKEFRDDDAAISDSLLAAGLEGKGRPGLLRSSSSIPLKFIRGVGQGVGRIGGKVTAALGDVAQEITGKQVFNSTAARSIVTEALERRRSTEALARRIWMSFVIEGREALFLDDIIEVLGAGKEVEAEECFIMLDRDGNGDISLDEMVLAIGEIGRMRKSLNKSMHDVDQAIHVLDNLLATVAFIIGVLVFISFVTSGFGTVIAAGATTLLSLSFIFSTTAQEVLGSCIFLFVKHPFDIGDRVEVDSKPYIVERISLLFSVFRNVGDHRTTQVPNAVLNTLWIDNFTRSQAMREKLVIPVSFDTTFSDIQVLKEEMELFVRDKDNSRDFQPEVDVDVTGVGDMDKLELTVSVCHKSNWSIEAVRAARRSKFMCALIVASRKIPIRAPGAAAPEETPADDNDNTDDKPEDPFNPSPSNNNNDGMRRAGMADPSMTTTTSVSQSTGFDMGHSSSGSLQRRAAAAAAGASSSSAYSNPSGLLPTSASNDLPQRTHSPQTGEDPDHYQTPAASPNQNRQLSVNYGSLTREASTGRRKEGTSTTAAAPSPFDTTATGGVPILAEPVPPSSSSSASASRPQQQHPQPHLQGPGPEQYRYPGQYYENPEDRPELASELDPPRPHGFQEYGSPASSQPSPMDPRFATDEQMRAYMSRRQ